MVAIYRKSIYNENSNKAVRLRKESPVGLCSGGELYLLAGCLFLLQFCGDINSKFCIDLGKYHVAVPPENSLAVFGEGDPGSIAN